MEVLFHFGFELFKIAILASIYSILVLLIITTIEKQKAVSGFGFAPKSKSRLVFKTWSIISLILFCYMLTYWGDHGLGDSSRIPIGHGKAVEQADGERTYIKANGFEAESLQIEEFATTKDFLFAKVKVAPSGYIVWNLKTNNVDSLKNDYALKSFLQKHEALVLPVFQNFWEHYRRYWNGWRFWLLP